MKASNQLRVFISSPGDVAEERVIAERIIKRTSQRFRGTIDVEPVFWEHEPLLATDSFQPQIDPPSQADIVVTILWSRIGQRLPAKIRRHDGSRYESGTEYEFEDATLAYKKNGTPDLLVYRKTAEPLVSLRDPSLRDERIRQWDRLNDFIQNWFHDDEGCLSAAFHPFETPAQFESNFEKHLQKLVQQKIDQRGLVSAVRQERALKHWTAGSPFRGLDVFEYEHSDVFFGRTKATGDVIRQLRQQAESGHPFVLIMGMSGSGKSSLVRAGVLPMLTSPGVVPNVYQWRRGILKPSSTSGDLFDRLAEALISETALPELCFDGSETSTIADSIRRNPQSASVLVKGALSQAASQLKTLPCGSEKQLGTNQPRQPTVRLVLVLDQLEEVFTNHEIDDQQKCDFFLAIASMVESGQAWVLATLRSDFYQHTLDIEELSRLKQGHGLYDLKPPTPAEMGHMICRPAESANLRYEKDENTGNSLDELLRDEASAEPDCLPLLEFTLEELYQARSNDQVLTLNAFNRVGGVAGALANRADDIFERLHESSKKLLPSIFRELVAVSANENDRPMRRVALLSDVCFSSDAQKFVDDFVRARLLTTDKGPNSEPTVRVTHEALLTRWKPIVDWFEKDRGRLVTRARVSEAAARWMSEGKRRDLLLPKGKPLEEAKELVESGFELTDVELEFVSASGLRSIQGTRVKRLAVASLLLLLLSSVTLAVIFANERIRRLETQDATQEREINRLQQLNHQQAAMNILVLVGKSKSGKITPDEIAAFNRLANSSEPIRLSFIDQILVSPDRASGIAQQLDYAIHAAVGVDFDMREKVVERILFHEKSAGDSLSIRFAIAQMGRRLIDDSDNETNEAALNSVVLSNCIFLIEHAQEELILSSMLELATERVDRLSKTQRSRLAQSLVCAAAVPLKLQTSEMTFKLLVGLSPLLDDEHLNELGTTLHRRLAQHDRQFKDLLENSTIRLLSAIENSRCEPFDQLLDLTHHAIASKYSMDQGLRDAIATVPDSIKQRWLSRLCKSRRPEHYFASRNPTRDEMQFLVRIGKTDVLFRILQAKFSQASDDTSQTANALFPDHVVLSHSTLRVDFFCDLLEQIRPDHQHGENDDLGNWTDWFRAATTAFKNLRHCTPEEKKEVIHEITNANTLGLLFIPESKINSESNHSKIVKSDLSQLSTCVINAMLATNEMGQLADLGVLLLRIHRLNKECVKSDIEFSSHVLSVIVASEERYKLHNSNKLLHMITEALSDADKKLFVANLSSEFLNHHHPEWMRFFLAEHLDLIACDQTLLEKCTTHSSLGLRDEFLSANAQDLEPAKSWLRCLQVLLPHNTVEFQSSSFDQLLPLLAMISESGRKSGDAETSGELRRWQLALSESDRQSFELWFWNLSKGANPSSRISCALHFIYNAIHVDGYYRKFSDLVRGEKEINQLLNRYCDLIQFETNEQRTIHSLKALTNREFIPKTFSEPNAKILNSVVTNVISKRTANEMQDDDWSDEWEDILLELAERTPSTAQEDLMVSIIGLIESEKLTDFTVAYLCSHWRISDPKNEFVSAETVQKLAGVLLTKPEINSAGYLATQRDKLTPAQLDQLIQMAREKFLAVDDAIWFDIYEQVVDEVSTEMAGKFVAKSFAHSISGSEITYWVSVERDAELLEKCIAKIDRVRFVIQAIDEEINASEPMNAPPSFLRHLIEKSTDAERKEIQSTIFRFIQSSTDLPKLIVSMKCLDLVHGFKPTSAQSLSCLQYLWSVESLPAERPSQYGAERKYYTERFVGLLNEQDLRSCLRSVFGRIDSGEYEIGFRQLENILGSRSSSIRPFAVEFVDLLIGQIKTTPAEQLRGFDEAWRNLLGHCKSSNDSASEPFRTISNRLAQQISDLEGNQPERASYFQWMVSRAAIRSRNFELVYDQLCLSSVGQREKLDLFRHATTLAGKLNQQSQRRVLEHWIASISNVSDPTRFLQLSYVSRFSMDVITPTQAEEIANQFDRILNDSTLELELFWKISARLSQFERHAGSSANRASKHILGRLTSETEPNAFYEICRFLDSLQKTIPPTTLQEAALFVYEKAEGANNPTSQNSPGNAANARNDDGDMKKSLMLLAKYLPAEKAAAYVFALSKRADLAIPGRAAELERANGVASKIVNDFCSCSFISEELARQWADSLLKVLEHEIDSIFDENQTEVSLYGVSGVATAIVSLHEHVSTKQANHLGRLILKLIRNPGIKPNQATELANRLKAVFPKITTHEFGLSLMTALIDRDISLDDWRLSRFSKYLTNQQRAKLYSYEMLVKHSSKVLTSESLAHDAVDWVNESFQKLESNYKSLVLKSLITVISTSEEQRDSDIKQLLHLLTMSDNATDLAVLRSTVCVGELREQVLDVLAQKRLKKLEANAADNASVSNRALPSENYWSVLLTLNDSRDDSSNSSAPVWPTPSTSVAERTGLSTRVR